jgi:hypothetical protein
MAETWYNEDAFNNAFKQGYAAGFTAGTRNRDDDPEADGTDFAHPAWWRGNERAFLTAVHEVNDILDGTKTNVGISIEPWQSLRQRLYDIRTLLGIAERIVGEAQNFATFKLNVSQWHKVRRDYEQRVQGIRLANAKGKP